MTVANAPIGGLVPDGRATDTSYRLVCTLAAAGSVLTVPFTDQVPAYMHAADVLLSNPKSPWVRYLW